FQVCKRIREISDVPIIILSARGREFDKVTALDFGADDYLTKPFGVAELLARVRAALRRGVRDLDTGNGNYEFGDLSLDLSLRKVIKAGKEVKLTPTEFSLLSLFVRNAGKILTHRYVLEAVWGGAYTDEREYLRAYVYNLRRKIEPDARAPMHILNVPGVGYQFSTGGAGAASATPKPAAPVPAAAVPVGASPVPVGATNQVAPAALAIAGAAANGVRVGAASAPVHTAPAEPGPRPDTQLREAFAPT
ncbi:MAG: response regulator transcription factor, partial [Chloroflexi bacterium]|nr:response regulator transcription factor [Chloroflexota bacterium]